MFQHKIRTVQESHWLQFNQLELEEFGTSAQIRSSQSGGFVCFFFALGMAQKIISDHDI